MLNAKLVVVGGEVKTTEIKLKLPCIIGRGKGSTVTLPHPLVSRQHCELFEADGQLWVRDLGSLNGTYVNNEKITEIVLQPNELLTVGTVTFRAVYEPQPSVSPPGGPSPQFLPSKAQQDDDQPTIRADAVMPLKEAPASDVVEDVSDEDLGMPSTPLFEDAPPAPPTVPMPAPQRSAPAKVIPMAVTPQPSTTAPTEPGPIPLPNAPQAEAAEAAGDDEDLNDFLKSLGKK